VRILVVLKYIPSPSVDLKGDLLWSLIEGLEAAGNEVVLLTDGRAEKHDRPQIPVPYSHFMKWGDRICNKVARLTGWSWLEYYFLRCLVPSRVQAFHRRHPIDIVAAECTSDTPAIIAHRINQKLNISFVVREHKNYESRATTVSSMATSYVDALRAAACLVAVSEGQAQTIRDAGVRNDIAVIENPLSEAFFVAPTCSGIGEKFDALQKILSGGPVFGAWTRWRSIKRLDLILEAFASAHAKNSRLRLVIAGPIEIDQAHVASIIEGTGIADTVLFWGRATREEIHRLAFLVDCVVVPSDYETFALPVIEGMAAGKPAIVTRCNGPEGVVSNPRLGRVVDRGNSQDLAAAMLEFASEVKGFDAEFIKAHAREHYAASRIGVRYSALLAAVCHSNAVQSVS